MALDPTTTLPRRPLERPLRVAFFGTPALAVESLNALLERPDLARVVAVVAQPDKPVGRSGKLRAPPVARRATEVGLPLHQPRRVRTGAFPEALEALDLDVAVVVAYGRILTTRHLETPRFGCVNLHASLLPAYRGAGPIQWAIVRGDQVTGVSTMWMTEGLDSGPILRVREEPIRAEDTAASLGRRLGSIGAELLVSTLEELQAGTLTATPQPEEGVSLAPLLSKEDGRLRWDEAAASLACRVRGLSPWPGAWCAFREGTLKVHRAEVRGDALDVPVGAVARVDDDGLLVRCGVGSLLLTEVQPPGRKSQAAADFARGYRPELGESLVAPAPVPEESP